MKTRNWTGRHALLLALLPLGLLAGCPDESVADKLEEVGNDVKRDIEDAAD